jgi:hypothetical protein
VHATTSKQRGESNATVSAFTVSYHEGVYIQHGTIAARAVLWQPCAVHPTAATKSPPPPPAGHATIHNLVERARLTDSQGLRKASACLRGRSHAFVDEAAKDDHRTEHVAGSKLAHFVTKVVVQALHVLVKHVQKGPLGVRASDDLRSGLVKCAASARLSACW